VSATVTCPTTGEAFKTSIRLEDHLELVQDSGGASDKAETSPQDSEASKLPSEFVAWQAESRAKAVSFCTTMLTTSAGAVAIYFSVLKFLGTESLDRASAGWLAIVAPALFFVSVGLFAFALLPRLVAVSAADFAAFRDTRLRAMNRWLLAGVATFMLGLLAALCAFAWAI
jgi:hypothetical protein